MLFNTSRASVGVAAALASAAVASAGLVGTAETFGSGSANWTNATGTAFLDWSPAGGPDGSAFASGVFDFTNSVDGDTPVILRAETPTGASAGALFGDYITGGVTELRFSVRHDGPAPLTFFTRFATAGNFPGATAIAFAPVFANAWTEVSIAIDPNSPAFVTFEGSDFSTIFSNVGRLQFGVSVDAGLAGFDQPVRFDIDNVRLIPAPGGIGLAGLALIGCARRRRAR
ncbi:MAG: hypothetical protein ACF8QF_10635 [Phycisphaerales bacterium]